MTDTTYEEASRCYKCGEPAQKVREQPAPRGPEITRGATLHIFVCRNTRCKLFDQECRVVQVNPDGTIPTPMRRTKSYPARPDRVAQVQAMTDEQLALEVHGGGELTTR